MSSKRIIVIGGSAAGPKAASKARRMDENAEIIRSSIHSFIAKLY